MIRPACAHSLNLKRKFQSSEVSLTRSLCLCDTLECSASEFVVLCKGGFFFFFVCLFFFLSLDIFQNNCLLLGRLGGCFPWQLLTVTWQLCELQFGTRCVDKFHPILRRSVWNRASGGWSEFKLIPLVRSGCKLFISPARHSIFWTVRRAVRSVEQSDELNLLLTLCVVLLLHNAMYPLRGYGRCGHNEEVHHSVLDFYSTAPPAWISTDQLTRQIRYIMAASLFQNKWQQFVVWLEL